MAARSSGGFFSRSAHSRFPQTRLHAKGVVLVVGEAAIHAKDLHRAVDISRAQVTDGPRYVEHESEDFGGSGESLRGHKDHASKDPLDEMIIQILFIHAVNFAQDHLSLGL